jgi:hypothetical protein
VGTTLRAGAWVGLQQSMFHSPTVMLRAADSAQATKPFFHLRIRRRPSPAHVHACTIALDPFLWRVPQPAKPLSAYSGLTRSDSLACSFFFCRSICYQAPLASALMS